MQVIDRKTLKSATGGQFGGGRTGRSSAGGSIDSPSGGGTTMGTRIAPVPKVPAPPPRRR